MNSLVASCPLAGGDAEGSLNSQVSINSVLCTPQAEPRYKWPRMR